jgi:hypothetical protein
MAKYRTHFEVDGSFGFCRDASSQNGSALRRSNSSGSSWNLSTTGKEL